MICRAGALTVSEVACVGVAALFVPLPTAIDDHQTANANVLVSNQAALLLPQAKLNPEHLVPLLQSWLSDKTPLVHMAQQARSCAIDDAAEQVADALSQAGYATTTTKVGGPVGGIQICQHHCPVSHVAEEFPELCEEEQQAISEVLGTHVQRLATIVNGDCACTTHVPLNLTTRDQQQQGESA